MRNTCVVIVTYNGMQWLPKCLESVKDYPIIIVDNQSTDNTIDFLTTHHPEIILFKNDKNLGFGRANNVGIKAALKQGAEYVFLLNQDAYLGEKVITKLIKIHKKNNKFGVLSPVHLNGGGTRLDGNFSLFVGFEGNKDFYSDYILNKEISDVYEVPFVNAAGWLISRECIEKVGGFDPIFFHYGEDENYCQRVKYHGYKVGVVPGIFLRHDREKRKKKKEEKKFSRFQVREKEIKVKYGDINTKYDTELEILMKKRKRFAILSKLKLKFKDAEFYRKEYKYLYKLVDEIRTSRRINAGDRKPYL